MSSTSGLDIVSKETKKHTKSKNHKSQPIVPDDDKIYARGENSAYKPPNGSVLLNHNVDSREFDWDEVKNNDDLELWLIRIPDGVSISSNVSYFDG